MQFEGMTELEIQREGDTILLRPVRPNWTSFAGEPAADADFLAEHPAVVQSERFDLWTPMMTRDRRVSDKELPVCGGTAECISLKLLIRWLFIYFDQIRSSRTNSAGKDLTSRPNLLPHLFLVSHRYPFLKLPTGVPYTWHSSHESANSFPAGGFVVAGRVSRVFIVSVREECV